MTGTLLSFRSIVFWRHVAGVGLLLLLQKPSLYSNALMFAGFWVGTATISFGGAAIISCFMYLFFTSRLKGKGLLVFVVCAWSIAVLQLFGQWILPSIVSNIATSGQVPIESSGASASSRTLNDPRSIVAGGKGDCPIDQKHWDDRITRAHPKWKETLKSRDWASWFDTQPRLTSELAMSLCPEDIVYVLELYYRAKKLESAK